MLGLRRSNDEWQVIRGGLADRWRDRPVTEITTDNVWAVVDEAKRQGVPGLDVRVKGVRNSRARRMLSALSTFFRWCKRERKIATNPCTGIRPPETPKIRDRVLTDTEIVAFWNACDEMGDPFGPAMKLLLLTGARLREVTGMTRAEISEDGATWNLASSQTKNRKPHLVPLPPLARDIINNMRRIEGERGLIFTTNGKTPISGWSKTKARLDGA